MKRIIERFPVYLMLLPAFVVVHFEMIITPPINYNLVLDKIIILFCVPFLFLLLFYLFFRSWNKAALMSFVSLLFFYFTGDVKNWLSQNFPRSIGQSYTLLLPVCFLILLVVFIILKKTKSTLQSHVFIINLAMLLFIAADLIQIFLKGHKGEYTIASESEKNLPTCDTCSPPDIFYIIFDAYTSSEYLNSRFRYSNCDVEEDLKSKGFRIIPRSRSNYNFTAYSIGSVLNMNYIENVDTSSKNFDRAYMQALNLVYKNRICSLLLKKNYVLFNHSIFDIEAFPSTLQGFDPWNLKDFFDQYNLLLKFNLDIGKYPPFFFLSNPAKRLGFDSTVYHHLMESAKLKLSQPKFIYAHFLRPHPPYFFDSLGQDLKSAPVTNKDGYLHQIAYSNKIIKKITDSIITYAQKPLVIIIQGDHGISFTGPANSQDYFPNFNALYFSTKDYKSLNDSMSSVNTFRVVMNSFFKRDLELLPDHFFFVRF
jgi:sulfatase-like protein